MSHCNVHFFAHSNYVLVSDSSEGLRILLECEVGSSPFFKKSRENISWLTSNHKEPTIKFP